MLNKVLFNLISVVYGVYLYIVILVFRKMYLFEINDVNILLNRFLYMGVLGILVMSGIGVIGFEKRYSFRKRLVIPVACSVILVITYYLFVGTAINMTAWMDVPINNL